MTSVRKSQAGFTLLELLVVIAILGVLSGGAVLAMGAVRETAQRTTCEADAEVIGIAEDAVFTLDGNYLDEQGLVDAGYLKDVSTLHDVNLIGSTYEVVPVGDCDTSGSELAEGATGDEAADEKAAAEKAAAEKAAERAADEKAAEEKAAAERAAEEQSGDAAADVSPEDKARAEASAAEAAKKAEEAALAQAASAKEAEAAAEAAKQAAAGGCRQGQIDLNAAEKKQLREVKGLSESDVKEILEQAIACVA